MTQMPVAPQTSVRHGLIEDWRDALGILLLLVVAAFFGALVTRVWPVSDDTPASPNSEISSRLTALETKPGASGLSQRIANLEARVAGFEKTLPASGAPNATTSASPETAKRLDELVARLSVLETRTATTPADVSAAKTSIETLTAASTATTTRIDDVAVRLAKLESSDLLDLARRASLATAIANLTRAAQGSSPFKTEYDVVAALVPGDTHLASIAPLAIKGIPTTGTLVTTFSTRAEQAMDAEGLSKGKTWGQQLWANFAALVSWRATGESDGNSSESRLARAELRLKSGDLEAAVKELNAIKGAARKPLASWLANAQARVTLEASLAALNTKAIQAITGPTDTSEPVPQLPAP